MKFLRKTIITIVAAWTAFIVRFKSKEQNDAASVPEPAIEPEIRAGDDSAQLVPAESTPDIPLDWQPEECVFPWAEKKSRRSNVQRTAHDAGECTWHFRSHILDRLDEYFVCIRRLKRFDPESYKFFSKMGFSVPAEAYANPDHQRWKDTLAQQAGRLSFGGVLGPLSDDGLVTPSFMYFKKIKHPYAVESFRGDVYELTMLYDNRKAHNGWRSNLAVPVRCHIGLGGDGSIALLREIVAVKSSFVSTRRGRKRDKFSLVIKELRYPLWVTDVCEDAGRNPVDWASDMFAMSFLTYKSAVSRIVVRAKANGVVAAFGIDVTRAKYFFNDRDNTELAADGRRKRIFHSVVQHTRRLHNQNTTQVRYHYRGLRDFRWNSYGIHIVLPKNNALIFDKAMYDSRTVSKAREKTMMSEVEVADRFVEVMNS